MRIWGLVFRVRGLGSSVHLSEMRAGDLGLRF
jgi:hypothetical protein